MSQEPRVYIAGPMSGLPEFNFPAFFEAEKRWEERGWEVLNPARLDIEAGYDPAKSTVTEGTVAEFITRDLQAIQSLVPKRDAIALLPGWSDSMGAKAELAVAIWMGLKVFDADTGRPFAQNGNNILLEAEKLTSATRNGEYGHPLDHFQRTIEGLNARFLSGSDPLFRREMVPQEWPRMVAIDKLVGRGEDTKTTKRDTLTDTAGYCRTIEMVDDEEKRRGE